MQVYVVGKESHVLTCLWWFVRKIKSILYVVVLHDFVVFYVCLLTIFYVMWNAHWSSCLVLFSKSKLLSIGDFLWCPFPILKNVFRMMLMYHINELWVFTLCIYIVDLFKYLLECKFVSSDDLELCLILFLKFRWSQECYNMGRWR
jgi:hypothetical protein